MMGMLIVNGLHTINQNCFQSHHRKKRKNFQKTLKNDNIDIVLVS